jgi:hypothetical protein
MGESDQNESDEAVLNKVLLTTFGCTLAYTPALSGTFPQKEIEYKVSAEQTLS